MNCSNYTRFNLFQNYFEILDASSSYTSQLMANSSDPVIDDIPCPSNRIHLSQCSITIPTDSKLMIQC